MSTEQKVQKNSVYWSVNGGTLATKTTANDPEAELYEYELPDGTKGSKYIKRRAALFGKVEGVWFQDGTYGKSVNIALDLNEDGLTPVMSFGVETRYGEDILKKLPNLKTETAYKFAPYDFTTKDTEKRKTGVTIATRNDEGEFTEKVGNFFWDAKANDGEGGPINGYPEPTEEDRSDWAFL